MVGLLFTERPRAAFQIRFWESPALGGVMPQWFQAALPVVCSSGDFGCLSCFEHF